MTTKLQQWYDWVDSRPDSVLLDGGLGYVLSERGHDLSIGSLWSARLLVTRPDELKEVARSWLAAGSELIMNASYQACAEAFCQEFSMSRKDAEAVMRSSVTILSETIASFWESTTSASQNGRRFPKVGVSLGPYSATLPGANEYSGLYNDVSVERITLFHSQRCAVFDKHEQYSTESDIGIYCFETIGNTEEVLAIVDVMNTAGRATQPYWISFQCRDAARIACGDRLDEVVTKVLERCASRNLVAIGVNCVSVCQCGKLMEIVSECIKRFMVAKISCAWRVDTLVYPNSAEVWTEGKWMQEDDPNSLDTKLWAKHVDRTGARLQGGCCRTGSEHIHALYALRGNLNVSDCNRPGPT